MEIAYAEIRRRILEGSLPEGGPIRQDDIAAQTGVSKIPVREALMRLQSEGWVSFTRNVGAVVTSLSVSDYVEMLDMRIALECRALELAVPQMAPSDLAQARELLDAYGAAGTPQQWSDLNFRFHQCLYNPSGRPRLVAMAQSVQERMGRLMRLRVTMASEHARSTAEHAAILGACQAGEAKLAVRLLKKHIEQTQREVKAHFRKEKEKPAPAGPQAPWTKTS